MFPGFHGYGLCFCQLLQFRINYENTIRNYIYSHNFHISLSLTFSYVSQIGVCKIDIIFKKTFYICLYMPDSIQSICCNQYLLIQTITIFIA